MKIFGHIYIDFPFYSAFLFVNFLFATYKILMYKGTYKQYTQVKWIKESGQWKKRWKHFWCSRFIWNLINFQLKQKKKIIRIQLVLYEISFHWDHKTIDLNCAYVCDVVVCPTNVLCVCWWPVMWFVV